MKKKSHRFFLCVILTFSFILLLLPTVSLQALADYEENFPTLLSAVAGDGQVELEWTAPSSDVHSGSALSRYWVRYGTGSQWGTYEWVEVPVTVTSYTVTNLENGTEYSFYVQAQYVGAIFGSNILSATPLSSNASLNALAVSSGSLNPAFESGIAEYAVSVENGISSINITPTASEANATIKVNGTAVSSGEASGNVILAAGANTISIAVTASDGTTTKTYNVTVTRAPANDASLSALSLSSGTLTPAFVPSTTGYALSVESSVESITVTPVANEANAVITVNGTTTASGDVSSAIGLSEGSNTITVTVTAQDGTTTNTYAITVTRAAASSSSGGGSSATRYTINATGGEGGSISPSGSTSVISGNDKTYTITADDGYEIEGVLVDGGNVGAVSSYTFKNVKKAHKITASFKEIKALETIASDNPFTDVGEDDWFYKNVLYVYENGLMTGKGGGTFAPDGTLTRGMFVTILYRMSKDTGNYSNGFSDIKSGEWFEDAVVWAAANGIVSGIGNDRFDPNGEINREQLAVMLYNYAKYKGYDMSVDEDTNILSYGDALNISDYAYSAMQWICGVGVLYGDTSGNLNPQGLASRAEAAAIMMRFMGY